MNKETIFDRRSGKDRRLVDDRRKSIQHHEGLEKRSGKDRRKQERRNINIVV